jgi:RNA polymerase sigma-32 factor
LFFKLRRLRARIGEADGGPLSEEGRQKIAETIGVTVNDVVTMEQRLSGADMSLNAAVNTDSENEAQDFLADERPNPEKVVIELHDKEVLSRWLAEALNELSARERLIILRRRLNEEGATLEQLGRTLGVSKERVRQLEHRALKKLQITLETQSTSILGESSLDLLAQFS